MKKEKQNDRQTQLSQHSSHLLYPVEVRLRNLRSPPYRPYKQRQTNAFLEILDAFEVGYLTIALLFGLQTGKARNEEFRLCSGRKYKMIGDPSTGAVNITPIDE